MASHRETPANARGRVPRRPSILDLRSSTFPALCLLLAGLAPAQEKPAEKPPDLSAGMRPQEVSARLGAPTRVSRQVFAHRCLEQWHYGPPHNLRLEFDCPRGQVPRLLGPPSRPTR